MKKTKNFIAVSGEVLAGKLIYLNSSVADDLTEVDGITTAAALNYLHGLAITHKDKNTVFVCYSFKAEFEHIFSGLPEYLKDELFQSYEVKKTVDELRIVKDDLENVYYDKTIELSEDESILHYNQINEIKHALLSVGKIIYNDYRIELMNGKRLTITKDKVTFTIYDVFGYFRKPLSTVVKQYFNDAPANLTETKSQDLQTRKFQNATDCLYIAKLVKQLYTELAKAGIILTRFHGAGTITSVVFGNANARSEYKNFKGGRFLSEQARRAVTQSYYGARTEQLKLGRFDNINVYDLNSAYAEAILLLPKMLKPPIFSKYWNDEPFSCWLIEYDLPVNIKYGILPNRDFSQTIRYKRRGRGYFWQPEIVYLMQNYPECINVINGFYVPYVKANFTDTIRELYDLRLRYKAESNPLEKVIKLALTTAYGKFLQRVGTARYYNLHYGGFVTSFVRSKLLTATTGKESKTICFLTDAIHTTAKLDVTLGDDLGEYRYTSYNKGVYLGAGVYRLENDNGIKKATRGFTHLDFEQALKDIAETGVFTASQDFFIGHNLNRLAPIELGGYLKINRKNVKVAPFASKARTFDKVGIDLNTAAVESKLIDTYNGRESLEYAPNTNDNSDVIFEGIEAGKYL